jgi:hypothetical protein
MGEAARTDIEHAYKAPLLGSDFCGFAEQAYSYSLLSGLLNRDNQ